MELKFYLNILLKKWWIVVPIFLVTLTSGVVFTYSSTPLYSATSTYVVVPSSSFSDVRGFANGLEMLGRREEIATTFTEIASSRTIRREALDSLSLESGRDYSISSKLRGGTNVIEVSATGPNPAITRDLANAVGNVIENYVTGLYEVFTLVLLDPATTPSNPISPNTPLNITLAAFFGFVLGGGLAILSDYLEKPLSSEISVMNIVDSETGVYNREYFSQRLTKEMIRAKRNRYPLSLALLRIDNLSMIKGEGAIQVRSELLQKVGMLITQHLREEDIVGYFEKGVFALLLPDMSGENTKALMEYLQSRVAWTSFETSNGIKFNLKGIVGVASYHHNGTSRDELVNQANRALELAEVEGNGKAFLITDYAPVGGNHAV